MAKKPSLRLRTSMAYEDLESILARECKDAVQVHFEGLEDGEGQSRKVLTLVFSTDEDREKLRKFLGRPASRA